MTPGQHLARAMRAARFSPPSAMPRPAPALPVQRDGRPWSAPGVAEIDPLLADLLRIVAAAHRVKRHEMWSACREVRIVEARAEFCYRAARRPNLSICDIGRAIDKDHSAVRHAIGRYCESWRLPMPRGTVDLVAERKRRLARSIAGHRRRKLADRMTQEQDA